MLFHAKKHRNMLSFLTEKIGRGAPLCIWMNWDFKIVPLLFVVFFANPVFLAHPLSFLVFNLCTSFYTFVHVSLLWSWAPQVKYCMLSPALSFLSLKETSHLPFSFNFLFIRKKSQHHCIYLCPYLFPYYFCWTTQRSTTPVNITVYRR